MTLTKILAIIPPFAKMLFGVLQGRQAEELTETETQF